MSDWLNVQNAIAELEASSMIEMFYPIGHSIELAIAAIVDNSIAAAF